MHSNNYFFVKLIKGIARKSHLTRFLIGIIIGYSIGTRFSYYENEKYSKPLSYVRPRYIYEELKNRHKLFIGIFLTENFTETQEYDMHTFYFTNKKKFQKKNNILVESRNELFDLKVAKYIASNFIDKYDWFFLVNSSTFFRKPMVCV